MYNKCLSLLIFILIWLDISATMSQLRDFMREMEEMANITKQEVEVAYSNRCSTFSDCESHHQCQSRLNMNSQTCTISYIASCKDVKDSGCGKLYDFHDTTIRMPDVFLNAQRTSPQDPLLKEDVCYTKQLNSVFKQEAENFADRSDLILAAPQTFFGTSNGVFRIWPASHSSACDDYDTRIRPWFIAASSGPKDIVIVIDKSGSMRTGNRWPLAIDAAKSVIRTLTIADHFAIVLFANNAQQLSGFNGLERATKENIARAINGLDGVYPDGGTNFEDAFDVVYNLFATGSQNDRSSNCHRTILFLSDGEATVGVKEPTALSQYIANQNVYSATIFTYALGSGADEVMTKKIACEAGGIYTKIPDSGGDDLRKYMSSYYKLYAVLQGKIENSDFVTWVEPYLFNNGVTGTTVSTPVYDRTVTPPHWVGVLGIDFPVDALETAAGGSDSYQTVLDEIIRTSTATCPNIDTSQRQCIIEALRRDESSDGVCDTSSASTCSFTSLIPSACTNTRFPSNFWINSDWYFENKDSKEYIDRGCCEDPGDLSDYKGVKDPDWTPGECKSPKKEVHSLAIVLPIIFVLIGCSVFYRYYNKKSSSSPNSSIVPTAETLNASQTPAPVASYITAVDPNPYRQTMSYPNTNSHPYHQ